MTTAFSPCFDESLAHIGLVDLDLARRPGAREVMIARMSGSDSELCVELDRHRLVIDGRRGEPIFEFFQPGTIVDRTGGAWNFS